MTRMPFRAEMLVFVTLWLACSFTGALPVTPPTSIDLTSPGGDVPTGTADLPDTTSITQTALTFNSSSTNDAIGHRSSHHSSLVITTKPSPQSASTQGRVPLSLSTAVSTLQTTNGSHGTKRADESGFSIWKGLSIGLGVLCLLLLLAFMMTIAVLCRLRRHLQRITKTLYPTSTEEEHVYTELQIASRKSEKKKPDKVELQLRMSDMHEEDLNDDEIHSPMSPDPSMASPFTGVTATQTAVDLPPPVIGRPPKRPASLDEAPKTPSLDMEHIYENEGTNGDVMRLHGDQDEDDLYEDYSYSNNKKSEADSKQGRTESLDPVITTGDTSQKDQIQRLDSLSGLPESNLQRVNSQLGADGMPLRDIDEESIQDFDSGIPMGDVAALIPNESTHPKPYGDSKSKANSVDNNNSDTGTNNNDEFDFLPVYDDGIAGMAAANMDDDLQLYEDDVELLNHFAVTATFEETYENHGFTDSYRDPLTKSDAKFDLTDSSSAAFQTQFPSMPSNPMMNGQPPFNSGDLPIDSGTNIGLTMTGYNTEDMSMGTSHGGLVTGTNSGVVLNGTSPEPPTHSDPLGLQKSDTMRIRTDSSSTPDNYYLDLDDVTSVLKVEETKRVSSQFPSDFYIKNMDAMSAAQDNTVNTRFESTASNSPFEDSYRTEQYDGHEFQQDILQEFDNTIYSNVMTINRPDPFGDESTT